MKLVEASTGHLLLQLLGTICFGSLFSWVSPFISFGIGDGLGKMEATQLALPDNDKLVKHQVLILYDCCL